MLLLSTSHHCHTTYCHQTAEELGLLGLLKALSNEPQQWQSGKKYEGKKTQTHRFKK